MKPRERRIKREPWPAEDIAFLKENYAVMDTEEIAERMGRSAERIRAMARYHGIRKKLRSRGWTEEKIAWLKVNYGRMKQTEMAEHLGCSAQNVNLAIKKYIRLCEKPKPAHKVKKERDVNGDPKRIGENRNPVTGATKTLISICVIDNMKPKDIATMTARSVEQVEELVDMVKTSGYLAWIEERRKTGFPEEREAARHCAGFRSIRQEARR